MEVMHMKKILIITLLLWSTTMNAADIQQLQKNAKQGDAEAQSSLGYKYSKGEGVPQDYKKAFHWYTLAASQNDILAQVNLGFMYAEGQGVEQDYKKAFEWYTKAANQGEATAQYCLGLLYDEGHGVAQDYSQALKWYTKATDQEEPYAQYNVGNMYYEGRGVEKNYQQAFNWFIKAAEQGYATAEFATGNMYANGEGVEKDYQKAIYWYEKAEKQGHHNAKINLGIITRRLNKLNISKTIYSEPTSASEEISHDSIQKSEPMSEKTIERLATLIDEVNTLEIKERTAYYHYLVKEKNKKGSLQEHIAEYASLAAFGQPVSEEIIRRANPPHPFPSGLIEFYKTKGAFYGGSSLADLEIYSLDDLLKQKDTKYNYQKFYSLGLADMINYIWGNSRDELDPTNKDAMFSKAQIDYLNNNYTVIGSWTDPHRGEEAHYYIYYDKYGRFDILHVDQDEWDIDAMFKASPARLSFDQVINKALANIFAEEEE